MLDWLAYSLVKTIGALACRLPPAAAVWLGQQLGTLAYWFAPKRTRIGVINLRAAFNGQFTLHQSRRIIHAAYQELGAGVVELLRLPVIDRTYIDRYVTVDGMERLEAAAASGKPLILLTAHYGNWELSSIVAALKGYPIAALARVQQRFPRLYRLLVSYRESKGCRIFHKGGAMRQLIKALDARQPIGIVGDQASRQGILVEFFGRPALFATGPFELAYEKEAIILPAFTRRVQGPFQHIRIEPPLALSRDVTRAEAIRQGVETFATLLARHITEEPHQWLWMHKRWKHTPARRALILSDGKLGHVKQSRAVIDALQATHPQLTHQVVEVRYRSPLHRLLALLWSWWGPPGLGPARPVAWTLTAESWTALLGQYADVIVSCGASLSPINVLWASENRAKSIVIMNPAPLPLHRFDLVIAPRHDGLPARRNVLSVAGAISGIQEKELQAACAKLETHPKFQPLSHPVIGVFIGGETSDYTLPAPFVESLIQQVITACAHLRGSCIVTTSRRTSQEAERLLAERLGHDARCRLLLLASRDQLNGTMEGMLGAADVAIVTGESISMVSEACASGRGVIVIEPPLRKAQAAPTKHQRFVSELMQAGYVRRATIGELSLAIQRSVAERSSARRLDNVAVVRDAVRRLL